MRTDRLVGIQLAHAGRKASHQVPWQGGKQVPVNEADGWQTLSASAIAFSENETPPVGMSKAEIEKTIGDFADAAARALKAGYKVIELHAAHGYLIHQFLSPLSNSRNDTYGGSFENRVRLLLEIVRGVKSIWPEQLPLFVRISATDWVEGGWDIEQSVQLSALLKKEGVDLVDCSSGGTSPGARIPLALGIPGALC